MNNRRRQKDKLDGSIRFKSVEIWNLYSTFSRIILAGLKRFKRARRWGHPGDMTPEEWEAKLDEMIWVFNECDKDFPNDPHTIWFNREYDKYMKEHPGEETFDLIPIEDKNGKINSYGYHDKLPNTPKEIWEERKLYNQRIQDGLKMFAECYLNLWD